MVYKARLFKEKRHYIYDILPENIQVKIVGSSKLKNSLDIAYDNNISLENRIRKINRMNLPKKIRVKAIHVAKLRSEGFEYIGGYGWIHTGTLPKGIKEPSIK